MLPWCQIMSPILLNEYVFYSGQKETLSPIILGKIGGLHWNRLFSAWSYVFGLTALLGSRGSALRVPRWMPDIWFL